MDTRTRDTMAWIARFFDSRKAGCAGNSGYRKTSDLSILLKIVGNLVERKIIMPMKSIFMDLGSGDGRVNMMMAYVCRWSLGFELEEFIYDEYILKRREVDEALCKDNLLLLPNTIHIWCGNSLDDGSYGLMHIETGLTIKDVDIFYTYITLHDTFAEFLDKRARRGAYYIVYGVHRILPKYNGFTLVDPDVAGQRVVALYKKS